MRFRRTVLLALIAAVIAGPAAAIAVAGSGPSAGDNQYTDPLGSSTKTHTTAPAPVTTAPPVQTVAPTATAPVPTATVVTDPSTTTASSSKKTLPVTGYAGWAGALLGAGLLGAGFAVRRRVGAR